MKDQELNFEGIEKEPLKTFAERAYLDYSMYVILDRALPHLGRRPEARAAAHRLRHERAGAGRRRQAQEIGAHGRRCDRQVPSARRFRLLRGHGAHGAGFCVPLSHRRRAGQLGLDGRPEILRRDALHRIAVDALCHLAAAGTGLEHRGLVPEFRRFAGRAHHAAGTRAESPAQRRVGHRGRHGDRHPAAQSARGGQGVRGSARRPGLEHPQDHGARQGSRFADRRGNHFAARRARADVRHRIRQLQGPRDL